MGVMQAARILMRNGADPEVIALWLALELDRNPRLIRVTWTPWERLTDDLMEMTRPYRELGNVFANAFRAFGEASRSRQSDFCLAADS